MLAAVVPLNFAKAFYNVSTAKMCRRQGIIGHSGPVLVSSLSLISAVKEKFIFYVAFEKNTVLLIKYFVIPLFDITILVLDYRRL